MAGGHLCPRYLGPLRCHCFTRDRLLARGSLRRSMRRHEAISTTCRFCWLERITYWPTTIAY